MPVRSSSASVATEANSLTLADRIERFERALTADELASLLSVSKVTIFKQAKAGRIPSFRIGTCVRFDPHAVARWLRTK
jgi:excisionase family DNA binding protein